MKAESREMTPFPKILAWLIALGRQFSDFIWSAVGQQTQIVSSSASRRAEVETHGIISKSASHQKKRLRNTINNLQEITFKDDSRNSNGFCFYRMSMFTHNCSLHETIKHRHEENQREVHPYNGNQCFHSTGASNFSFDTFFLSIGRVLNRKRASSS
jgi:hypothetical protein